MIKKLNSLTILLLVTIVMVVLMLLTIQRPADNDDDYSLLFPILSEQLNDVDTLKFKSSQDEFTLYKEGEDWYIKERWDHLADFDLVKRALFDISTAKIIERKTDDPEKHVVLGVEEAGGSLQIALLHDEQPLAGLILGNEREINQMVGPKQFYVRRMGENRAWLAEGYLNLNPLMLNWIKSEVINIARERIARVNIIQPSGQTATIINIGKKDAFGTPALLDKTVFKYDQLGYDIAGTLFQLRMEDVLPLSDFSRGDVEVVTAEFISFDGMKVIVETSFNEGAYYSTFRFEFDQVNIKAAPDDIQQLNVLKTADQVQQEVMTLNKQLAPWVYRFSGFVGTNLMRLEADIVTSSGQSIPMPTDLTGFGR